MPQFPDRQPALPGSLDRTPGPHPSARAPDPELRLPTVDCIIPTHGRPEFLAEALTSVSRQTRRPRQLFVVSDDGDQRSQDVVRHFQQQHPDLDCRHLHRSDGAVGVSASRNLGAASGSAEALAFLDDDDLWEPTYLETTLQELARAGVDAVATTLRRFSAAGEGPLLEPTTGTTARDVFRRSPGVTGSSLVVRREAFDRVAGFDPDLAVQNDRDLVLRLLADGAGFAVVRKPLVRFRRHGGGRLTDPSVMRSDGILVFLAKHGRQFSAWDRRVLRYTAHRTRLSAAGTRRELARSLLGCLVTWSPTASSQIPFGLLHLGHIRSAARRVSRSGRSQPST